MTHLVERYHDISTGHRVVGHENKCRHLHGHNYRINFTCTADSLDSVGRVIDFGVIKTTLCQWLEDNWDHKFLAWEKDALIQAVYHIYKAQPLFHESIVFVPFNPTAENMAEYLVTIVAPRLLVGTGVQVIACRVEETRKCSATYFAGKL